MIGFELIDENDVIEPLTLSEAKSWCNIDDDYPDHDGQVLSHITSARIFLEKQLNVALAKRVVKLNWTGEYVILPLYPVESVESVSENNIPLTQDKYTVGLYREKSIEVNEVSGSSCNYFYSITGQVQINETFTTITDRMFSVEYMVGYNKLPQLLKESLAIHVVYLYQNLGSPEFDETKSPALKMCSNYSRNLIF